MIPIDTNVLVRFLCADDAKQTKIVKALFQKAFNEGIKIYISKMVLIETIWVMKRLYSYTKPKLLAIIDDLLMHDVFRLEDPNQIEQAYVYFKKGRADFSDYLIAIACQLKNKGKLHTFDKKCKEKDLFIRVD